MREVQRLVISTVKKHNGIVKVIKNIKTKQGFLGGICRFAQESVGFLKFYELHSDQNNVSDVKCKFPYTLYLYARVFSSFCF